MLFAVVNDGAESIGIAPSPFPLRFTILADWFEMANWPNRKETKFDEAIDESDVGGGWQIFHWIALPNHHIEASKHPNIKNGW